MWMAMLSGASSGAYPEKQIWWIVPYAPGGSADVTSRILVTRLSQRLNQNILIDNKSGATGSIGATFVARAAPDGYTVGYGSFDLAINPLVRELPYDPLKDLTPVTQLSNLWEILVAPADAPYNTFAEFMEWARKNPDKVNFGTTGAASAGHLSGELFKKASKLEMTHIPFKGGGPGVAAAVGGQVSIYWGTGGSAMPSIKAGRLKALAVTAPTRLPALPNIPTFKELGYPSLIVTEWTGVFVPKGTPADIVRLLNREIRETLAEPAIAEQLSSRGIEIVTSSPEEFDQFVKGEVQRWRAVVKDLNLKYD
jgi:tripartite-type tricarboxylate transporter receptor subunit TctC